MIDAATPCDGHSESDASEFADDILASALHARLGNAQEHDMCHVSSPTPSIEEVEPLCLDSSKHTQIVLHTTSSQLTAHRSDKSDAFDAFLDQLGLLAFREALLHVTGLPPVAEDLATYCAWEDLQELLNPPYAMRMPMLKKLWAELQQFRAETQFEDHAPVVATITQQNPIRELVLQGIAGQHKSPTASVSSSRTSGTVHGRLQSCSTCSSKRSGRRWARQRRSRSASGLSSASRTQRRQRRGGRVTCSSLEVRKTRQRRPKSGSGLSRRDPGARRAMQRRRRYRRDSPTNDTSRSRRRLRRRHSKSCRMPSGTRRNAQRRPQRETGSSCMNSGSSYENSPNRNSNWRDESANSSLECVRRRARSRESSRSDRKLQLMLHSSFDCTSASRSSHVEKSILPAERSIVPFASSSSDTERRRLRRTLARYASELCPTGDNEVVKGLEMAVTKAAENISADDVFETNQYMEEKMMWRRTLTSSQGARQTEERDCIFAVGHDGERDSSEDESEVEHCGNEIAGMSKDCSSSRPVPVTISIRQLRFSHDSVNTVFNGGCRSILETAIALVSGATTVMELPMIRASRADDGRWYCETGNRRLGALRLAALCDPASFNSVRVLKVPWNKRVMNAKWTTSRNGRRCNGKWAFVRPNGNRHAGRSTLIGLGGGPNTYGMDLLSLLFPVARSRYRQALPNGLDTALALTNGRERSKRSPPPLPALRDRSRSWPSGRRPKPPRWLSGLGPEASEVDIKEFAETWHFSTTSLDMLRGLPAKFCHLVIRDFDAPTKRGADAKLAHFVKNALPHFLRHAT